MREILPLLEAAPYVFRYPWFASRWMVAGVYVDKSASLLKPYSAELTPLGHYYNNLLSKKCVSDFQQVSGFLLVLWFPPPKTLTVTI
jgi:hypothetical protein